MPSSRLLTSGIAQVWRGLHNGVVLAVGSLSPKNGVVDVDVTVNALLPVVSHAWFAFSVSKYLTRHLVLFILFFLFLFVGNYFYLRVIFIAPELGAIATALLMNAST